MFKFKKNFYCLFFAFVFLTNISLIHSQEVLDEIAAIVGDEIVLKSELTQMIEVYSMQMGIDVKENPARYAQLREQVLNDLINEKVLLARAEYDTVTVEDSQVEMALQGRIDDMIRQLGSSDRVEEYFGKSIGKIKNDYREQIREQMIVQKVRDLHNNDIQITRREVERFYETMKDSLPQQPPAVKLRHILMEIKAGEAAKQPGLKLMEDIQHRIRNGEYFSDLAKEYSQDPGTAKKGGELGWIERGTLFESFEDVAFELKPNEISDIVETPVGLHLIQLMEKDEVNDRVRVRHILIPVQVSDNDAVYTRDKLAKLRTQILNGEADFDVMAKLHSDDATSKDRGGDLGWLPIEEFQIEAFKSAVDTLKDGEISHPFQTNFGFHIVKLEGRRAGGSMTLDSDYENIKSWALRMKQQRVFDSWVNELKKEMYIEIRKTS